MGNRYKAAFLIPSSSKKILDDTGWLFESQERLPQDVLGILERGFLLQHKENYEGVAVYEGQGAKVSVIHDDEGLIEHIYIQLFTKTPEALIRLFDQKDRNNLEVFVP